MVEPACAACGTRPAPSDRFCSECGARLAITVGVAEPAPEAQPLRPRRWRDVGTVVALVAVLAVGTYVLVSVGGDRIESDGASEEPTVEPDPAAPTGELPAAASAVERSEPLTAAPEGVSFAYRDRAGVHIVELGASSTRLIEAGSIPPEVFPHPTFAAVDHWLVYVDEGRARMLDRAAGGATVDLGAADAVAPWPRRSGRPAVWLIDLDLGSPDVAPTVTAVEVSGEVVVEATALAPGSIVAGATIDGLVVANSFADGAFLLDSDGLAVIDDGRVLGVGLDWVGVWDCDAALKCGGRMLDLADGTASSVLGQAPAATAVALSPDRRWVAQLVAPDTVFRGATADLELRDQITGGSRRLDVDVFGGERLVWSPDGSILAWTGSNRLWFYRVADGSLARFPEPLRASSASPGEVVFVEPLG